MKEHAKGSLNLSFLNNYLLEDEIYLQLEKLRVLTSMQTMLTSTDALPTREQYYHYGLVLEDQISRLKGLIDELFM